MLTEKDYCDYDTSITLTKLGYKTEKVNLRLNKRLCVEQYPKILLYEAQKWLREEKDFIVLVDHILTEDGDWCYNITHLGRSAKVFKSYEEALSEGIKEAVKLLKEK